MKKIYSLMATVALVAAVSAQTTVASDNFSYTGSLNANGWTRHSGTAGQLSSDGAAANLTSTGSEDVNLAFTPTYTLTTAMENKVTYSATVTVLNSTGLSSTAGDYFLSLGTTSGTSVNVLPARLYVKAGTSGYLLGILNTSGGTVTPTFSTTEIPYGTPSNILVTYTANSSQTPTQSATLQIDSQPLLTNNTGTGAITAEIASIALRQGTSTGNVTVDNLVVMTYPAATLAVSDVKKLTPNFVKNSLVKNDEIIFGSDVKDIKVYTLSGAIVKTGDVKNGSALNVADLAKGNYIVTGIVNNEPVSQKILKD